MWSCRTSPWPRRLYKRPSLEAGLCPPHIPDGAHEQHSHVKTRGGEPAPRQRARRGHANARAGPQGAIREGRRRFPTPPRNKKARGPGQRQRQGHCPAIATQEQSTKAGGGNTSADSTATPKTADVHTCKHTRPHPRSRSHGQPIWDPPTTRPTQCRRSRGASSHERPGEPRQDVELCAPCFLDGRRLATQHV